VGVSTTVDKEGGNSLERRRRGLCVTCSVHAVWW
jgi:hypothetical protein